MSGAQYRVWIDGTAVDRAFYERLETVYVEQAIGMATEARLELESCADGRGLWKNGPSDPIARSWRRVRIEVKNGGTWTPLIDGPIVSWNATMASEPGRSMLVVTAHDDRALLHRMPAIPTIRWERRTPTQIAKSLLANYDIDIDEIPQTPMDLVDQFMLRGTPMEILLGLTRPYQYDVYVRPGDSVGDRSRAFVKRRDVTKRPSVPPLVLLGPDRNIDSFDARNDSLLGHRFSGSRINLRDMAVESGTSSWEDVSLLGDRTALDDPETLGLDLLDPVDAQSYDIIAARQAAQQLVSYQITASGTVRSGCYGGVLQPHETIVVGGVDKKLATKFLISDVTHVLGRSGYEQSFSLLGNAVQETNEYGQPLATPPVNISAR